MNYYISDLHLLHKNCIGFDERPFADLEEMHETILATSAIASSFFPYKVASPRM